MQIDSFALLIDNFELNSSVVKFLTIPNIIPDIIPGGRMKKIYGVCVCILAATMAWGYTGFLRMEPATGMPKGGFDIGLLARGFTYTPQGATDAYNGGRLVLGMDYGIIDNLAVGLWIPYLGDFNPDLNNKEVGLGDIGIGVKYSIADIFAIEPFLLTGTGKDVYGPNNGEGRFRYFTTGGVDAGVRGAMSYEIANVNLTGGVGYIYHSAKRTPDNADQYIGQLGVSYDLGKVQPFVELIGENLGGFGGDNPVFGPERAYLTPGVVFKPNSNLSLLLAVDVDVSGISEDVFCNTYPADWKNAYYVTAGPGKEQPWAVNFGVKYTIGVKPVEKIEELIVEVEEVAITENIIGRVTDRVTGKPIQASIAIAGMEPVTTDIDGNYTIKIEPGTYKLEAESDGYVSATTEVTIENGEIFRINFLLSPTFVIPEGGLSLEEITSLHIPFDFDKATLTREAKASLDKLALTLIHNPGLRLEIQGYTCEIGTEEYNLDLSIRRAEAVRDYLIKKGVSIKGFGETKPIDPGHTKKARAKNRRVEFIIIK